MRNFLETLNRDRLMDFLVEYAESDAKFLNALNVRFREPEFGKELDKIENEIENALAGASDYRRHDSWGYIDVDVSGIISEITLRAGQGHIKLAFKEAELLYRKLLENFEYQSECEISDEAENCLAIMSEIAAKAVLADDKDYIFRHCIALAELEDGKDYGADYEDRLLRIAAKFVTPENFAELDNALTYFDSDWREEEFKLIRLEIVRNIEGPDAANDFIANNLRFPKIREIAFAEALSRKDFAEGASLCLDALSEGEQDYGISPWLYKLYTVQELMTDNVKMAETAEKILLRGDLEYYGKLKLLLERQAAWDSAYPALLKKCEMKLPYAKYMEILAEEKEYDLLLEQTEQHMEQIYKYGKLLSAKYPAEIRALYTGQIMKEAKTAYGREAYANVCSHILCFAEAGYSVEADDIIDDFKIKYKRKPAFVDELKKIREAPQ